jgi:hypothetical protein
VRAVFAALGFPAITDEEVEAATLCSDSRGLPDRDRAADVAAADRILAERISGLDVARVLADAGFAEVAEAVLCMQRQRIAADYLQTSAIISPDGTVEAAVNDPNEYTGPGTGYRLEGERWEALQSLPHELDPRELGEERDDGTPPLLAESTGAERGTSDREVVIAVGPAFGDRLRETINGLRHEEVLAAVIAGVREGGAEPRLVRVRRTSDVAFIAHDGARLSGSGIGVGVQSKGTVVIHRADLQPLDNLELFGMAPLLTLDSYCAIGRNAAGYANGEPVGPVPTELDNFARAKLIVTTTLLHARETAAIVSDAPAVEVTLA